MDHSPTRTILLIAGIVWLGAYAVMYWARKDDEP